jgi:hypothetical protein
MLAKTPGVHPDATIKKMPLVSTETDALQKEKDEIAEAFMKLQEQQSDLRMKEALALEKERNQKFKQRSDALETAANFRQEARVATDEGEKRSLYEWAREAEAEARQLEIDLGIVSKTDEPEEPATVLPWMQRHKKLTALFQVIGVVILIRFCYGQFMDFKTYIDEINKHLPFDQHLQPYDLTSMQKFFYEQLVVFTSLPVALVILFLVVPFVGFYVLPFLKSRKDFYSEFYEDLTPWQRSIISTALLLGLLFFLALSHTVKP